MLRRVWVCLLLVQVWLWLVMELVLVAHAVDFRIVAGNILWHVQTQGATPVNAALPMEVAIRTGPKHGVMSVPENRSDLGSQVGRLRMEHAA